MKLNRCPICRCNVDIFALAEDEASSQLLAKLAPLDTLSGAALTGYLTLFSPAKTALTSSKALRLVCEVEALAQGNWPRIALAMASTVDTMRAKQQRGEEVSVFNSHVYLKKVLKQIPEGDTLPVIAPLGGMPQPKSAVGQALATLEAMK